MDYGILWLGPTLILARCIPWRKGDPSGAPKEEFGWMIFGKKCFLGDRTKVQSMPSAGARGGEAWHRNV